MPTSEPQETAQLRACLSESSDCLTRSAWLGLVAGAFAAQTYRASLRYTTDADLLVVGDERLVEVLENAGFDLRVFRDEGEMHVIRARRADCALDLIVATTEYQRHAIQRGLRQSLTIEDVLIHKLIAWRPKDRDDVASILSTGAAFDQAYVEQWVAEWDVEHRWREAQSWQ